MKIYFATFKLKMFLKAWPLSVLKIVSVRMIKNKFFYTSISLQPDSANLRYFKIRLFDQPKCIF